MKELTVCAEMCSSGTTVCDREKMYRHDNTEDVR